MRNCPQSPSPRHQKSRHMPGTYVPSAREGPCWLWGERKPCAFEPLEISVATHCTGNPPPHHHHQRLAGHIKINQPAAGRLSKLTGGSAIPTKIKHGKSGDPDEWKEHRSLIVCKGPRIECLTARVRSLLFEWGCCVARYLGCRKQMLLFRVTKKAALPQEPGRRGAGRGRAL